MQVGETRVQVSRREVCGIYTPANVTEKHHLFEATFRESCVPFRVKWSPLPDLAVQALGGVLGHVAALH
jgi:hypothetical protein